MSSLRSTLLVVCATLAALFSPSHAAVLTSDDLLFSRSTASSFPSHRHIEAVHVLDHFHVTSHGEPLQHFHPLSTVRHPFRTLAASPDAVPQYTHVPSSHAFTHANGQRQPFPDSVELHFRAFEQEFSLPMKLLSGVFSDNATVEVFNGEHELVETPAPLHSVYWHIGGKDMNSDYSMAVLREDGRFHLLFQQDGEVYQADPVEHFNQEMDAATFHTMATTAERGMAIYRHRDLKNREDKKCANKDTADETPVSARMPPQQSSALPFGLQMPAVSPVNGGADAATRRRLMQITEGEEQPTAANEATLTPFHIFTRGQWTTSPQRLSITILVDAGWYSLFNSVPDVQAAILSVIAASNIPLLMQLQTFVTVTTITIFTSPDTTGLYPFNKGSYTPAFHACPNYDINTQMGQVGAYRQNLHPYQGATHHLFTNCWPAPGMVGLSVIGWLCDPNNQPISVSSYNTPFWQTVVHEIGHTLGAQHTLGLGGIMDYFIDSRYPIGTGPYQFHPNNQAELQSALGLIVYSGDQDTAPYCAIDYQPTCGNGVVEPGETCDDDSACCTSNCTLAVGAQCSGNNTCCISNTCQFKPSSTTCAGGAGFCGNGQCLLSSCPLTFPFCGMDSTTGNCRQSCASGSFCYSGWNFGLNAPDGTVCNANGGVCNSGTCTTSSATPASTVTYTWTMGAWSGCGCSGTQNRSITCVGSDGTVAGTGQCQAASMPTAAQTCSIPSACYPYAWDYSAWSSCSASCDAGVQTRSATCMWMTSPPVQADGQCGALTQDPLTQQCNTQTCQYQYTVAQTWGACSASCGGGTQSRTAPTTCWRLINSAWQQMSLASCQSQLGYTVSDSQTCNTQACDVYGWSYGSWGSCSATCGGGSQGRSATCMDFTTNTQAASGNCSSVVPTTSQTCNVDRCPSFSWQYANWSSCSVTCGTGVVSRVATCYDSVYNQVYPAATCTAVLGPALTTSNCTETPCYHGNYQWQYSAWGTCSASCGGGNQTRQVACVDMNLYAVVPQSMCNAATKPATQQTCGTVSCNVYTWSVSSWGNCSATCGGGTQTRNVYCQNFWTHQLSSPSTCSSFMTSVQPASSQSCNTQACQGGGGIAPTPSNSSFSDGWSVGSWRQCDATCGGGVQTREVTCVNATLCKVNPEPATAQVCNTGLCPTYWATSSWSSCSATCNGGWMSRNVSCMEDVGGEEVQVDAYKCLETAPSLVGQCNYFPCPTWQYSDWSSCSTQCDYGLQSRVATCTKYDGTSLPASACVGQAQEAVTQSCMYRPCPHWHRSTWGECSQQCGGGNQTRQVTCRMPHDTTWEGQVVDASLCPTSGANIGGDGPGASAEPVNQVPALSQGCNAQQCPDFYWQWRATSQCSAQCGGGSQRGSYVCLSSDHSQVDSTLCQEDAMPMQPPACNTAPCSGHSWTLSAWSSCNVTCGAGVQYRNASCVATTGAVEDDTNCDSLSLPIMQQQCGVDESVCYGSAAGQVNGVCQADTGSCMCRPGYHGATCGSAPFISHVSTGAASYTTGVPLGETLMVTWEDSGSLPYVSVLLLKAGAGADWPVGQYIAQQLVNFGGYEWEVGSMLSDLDGGNYTVRVYFNEEVYADSAVFEVADPCGYVACGEHGSCSRGQCQCLPGFSGPDCSVGPCDARKCNWAVATECRDEDWFIYDIAGQIIGAEQVQCECQAGWSGALCATPPICSGELVCQNGADVNLATVFYDSANVTTDHYCGTCKCSNHWVGADCGTCPITCANGGVPDANCSQCLCPANSGFYGSSCQNRYYDFNLTLNIAAAPIMQDAVALARFERTVATDLAVAAALAVLSPQVSIAVQNVTARSASSLELQVRFGIGSPLTSNYDFGGSMVDGAVDSAFSINTAVSTAESSALVALMRKSAKNGRHMPRDLPTAWALFVSSFGDLDDQLYQGVVTSHIDPTASVVVTDPSGQDHPQEPALPTSVFVRSHSAASTSTGPAGGASAASASSSSLVSLAALAALPGVAVLAYLLYRSRRAAPKKAFSPRNVGAALADHRQSFDPFAASLPPVVGYPTSPFPRLPSSSDLEMVSSANSEDAMSYLQRSISDSNVSYQQYRNASSPVPDVEVDGLWMGGMTGQMRRSTSMDTLPTPPTLSPAVSSA